MLWWELTAMDLQRTNTFRTFISQCAATPWRVAQNVVAAAVASAGCVVAFSGAAEAAFICDFGGYAGPNGACSANQVLQFGDKRVTFSQLPTVGSGTIGLATIVQDVYTVQFIFFEPVLNPPPGSSGYGPLLPPVVNATTSYTVDIVNNPGWVYTGVKIDSVDAGVLGTTVIKTEGNNLFPTLTSSNGVPDPNTGDFFPIAGGYTSLDITDTYSISGQGALTSFTNTFRQANVGVPGPLPIVGVMAALGWSRRMRRRLQSASTV